MIELPDCDVDAVVQFVVDNDSRNVALQFPHDLISSAHAVLRAVKRRLDQVAPSTNVCSRA